MFNSNYDRKIDLEYLKPNKAQEKYLYYKWMKDLYLNKNRSVIQAV